MIVLFDVDTQEVRKRPKQLAQEADPPRKGVELPGAVAGRVALADGAFLRAARARELDPFGATSYPSVILSVPTATNDEGPW